MNKRNDDSIKRVQNLDWEDPMNRRAIRKGYIVEKWFQARRKIEKKGHSSDLDVV